MGTLVKALKEQLEIDYAAVRRDRFFDRAIKGLNDGYGLPELDKICTTLLSADGAFANEDLGKTLRTRCDFLILHSCMLR